MDKNKAVNDIQDFLLKAGAFALKNQKGVDSSFKDGQQIVTATDLAISAMAIKHFEPWLSQKDHILIDEESTNLTPEEVFNNYEYQWILDPIDGTAGYALGRKMWGISLALLHHGKPLVGGIYLPVTNELLMSDGGKSYKIDTKSGDKVELKTIKMDVNSQVFVESYWGGDIRWGKNFGQEKIWLNRPESAVQSFVSMLTNQAAGATFIKGYSVWDVAGAFVLASNTGYKVLSMECSSEWKQFTAEDFKDNWKLNKNWLLTHPENFEYISRALKEEY